MARQSSSSRWASLLLASLLLPAGPAAAQEGLPALRAQIDSLQAQVSSLQQQLNSLGSALGFLQGQVADLAGADDGTADAIVGAWNGSVNSIGFEPAVSPGPNPSELPFFRLFGGVPAASTGNFTVPLLGVCEGFVCQAGNMLVGVNPAFWLGRAGDINAPLDISFTRDGMKLTGQATGGEGSVPVSGVVVANNFFLFRAVIPAEGGCAGPTGTVVAQGMGTLNAARDRMLQAISARGAAPTCSSGSG
jgi:hypothetical protein